MEPDQIMEFLLQEARRAALRMAQAEERMDRAEQRMDRAEQRMDRAEQRMDRAEERMDRFEAHLRNLTRLGRRAFVALSQQQRETNARLDAVILLLERHLGGNGATHA